MYFFIVSMDIVFLYKNSILVLHNALSVHTEMLKTDKIERYLNTFP